MSLNDQSATPAGQRQPDLVLAGDPAIEGRRGRVSRYHQGKQHGPRRERVRRGRGIRRGTGLGSVDANVLVNHWSDTTAPKPAFQLTPGSAAPSLAVGASTTSSIAVTVSGGFNAPVTLALGTPPRA